jgi:hypothetical protein
VVGTANVGFRQFIGRYGYHVPPTVDGSVSACLDIRSVASSRALCMAWESFLSLSPESPLFCRPSRIATPWWRAADIVCPDRHPISSVIRRRVDGD